MTGALNSLEDRVGSNRDQPANARDLRNQACVSKPKNNEKGWTRGECLM